MNAIVASEYDVHCADCAIHDLARRPVDELPLSASDIAEWIATLESLRVRLEQAARAVA